MTDSTIMGVGGKVVGGMLGGDGRSASDVRRDPNSMNLPVQTRESQLTGIRSVFDSAPRELTVELMEMLSIAPALMEIEIDGRRTFLYMWRDQKNNTIVPIDRGDTDGDITFPDASKNTVFAMKMSTNSGNGTRTINLGRSLKEKDHIQHSIITYTSQKEGRPKLVTVHLFKDLQSLADGIAVIASQSDYRNVSFSAD